jgi:hypothetical protein
MAKRVYNTFVVVNCKTRKIELVTSSARKANGLLKTGYRVEVWNCNERVEKIHAKEKERFPMGPYIEAEKEFIGDRQRRAEENNKRRWMNGKAAERNRPDAV